MNDKAPDLDSSFGPSDSTVLLSQARSELSEFTSPPGSPSTSGGEATEALLEDIDLKEDYGKGVIFEGYAGEFLMALNASQDGEDDPWLDEFQAAPENQARYTATSCGQVCRAEML